jgi:hypothetical protein
MKPQEQQLADLARCQESLAPETRRMFEQWVGAEAGLAAPLNAAESAPLERGAVCDKGPAAGRERAQSRAAVITKERQRS